MVVKALIVLGCTHCLISQATVWSLGLHVRKLMKSMKFDQIDGTLMGGRGASHLMEPVQLKFRDYQETVRFMITLKMAEEIILGLTWLPKWVPWIYWEKASK